MQSRINRSRALLAASIMLVVTGCANLNTTQSASDAVNSLALPASYSTTGLSTLPNVDDEQRLALTQWWTKLDDPQLTQLIEQALALNYSLAAARASLEEAYALLGFERLGHFPQLQGNAGAVREKSSEDVRLTGAPAITETYSAGFDASWELDVFGSVRNRVKAAKASLAEREASLRALQISIAAETAKAYIDLRGAQHQLAVGEANAANLRETLALTKRLMEIGRGDQLDVSRSQAQLSLVEASLPGHAANITLALNRLSVLTGEHNSELRTVLSEPKPLPSVHPVREVIAPEVLIRHRPDIQQAEQTLAAAIARYNVRVADLYPRITFNGGLGYLSTELDRLGEVETETYRFGPSIQWAALNLGRVQAQIRAADARAQAELANFKRQVLRALEDTDNALQLFTQEEHRRAKLIEALSASQQSADIARKKYQLGAENFLSVLVAERERLNVSAQLAASDTKVLQDLIVVYKNLSGGWVAVN